MTLEHYQELAPKTLKDKGYDINCLHMALGMAGEIEEIFEAADQHFRDDRDAFRAALQEEGTDIKWFVVVLGTLKGVQFNSKRLAAEPEHSPEQPMLHQHIRNLVHHVLTLTDVVKREICYGKAKYQGVEVTPVKYEQLMYKVLAAVDQMFAEYGVNPEEGYDLNIQKLHGVRYKDGFSTEAATNRNLEAESKAVGTTIIVPPAIDEPNWSTTFPEQPPLDPNDPDYATALEDHQSALSTEKPEDELSKQVPAEGIPEMHRDIPGVGGQTFEVKLDVAPTKLADVLTDALIAAVPQEVLDTPVELPVTSSGSARKVPAGPK